MFESITERREKLKFKGEVGAGRLKKYLGKGKSRLCLKKERKEEALCGKYLF